MHIDRVLLIQVDLEELVMPIAPVILVSDSWVHIVSAIISSLFFGLLLVADDRA